MKRISIDPITRLEGHGKIEIFLADDGGVENCYFQVPELRGFEKFVEGMPVEEVPQIRERVMHRILDKIARHGIASLTDRERRTLEEAREKMRR